MVAVEVDGAAHFTMNEPFVPLGRTIWRWRLLASRGWRVGTTQSAAATALFAAAPHCPVLCGQPAVRPAQPRAPVSLVLEACLACSLPPARHTFTPLLPRPPLHPQVVTVPYFRWGLMQTLAQKKQYLYTLLQVSQGGRIEYALDS